MVPPRAPRAVSVFCSPSLPALSGHHEMQLIPTTLTHTHGLNSLRYVSLRLLHGFFLLLMLFFCIESVAIYTDHYHWRLSCMFCG